LKPRIVKSIVDDGFSDSSDGLPNFQPAVFRVPVGNNQTSSQDRSLDADDTYDYGYDQTSTGGCQPIAREDACEDAIVEGTPHDNHANTHNNDHDRVDEEPVQKCAQVPMVQTVQRIVEIPQIEYVDHRTHVPVNKHPHGPM
jgi:hypothetical protein